MSHLGHVFLTGRSQRANVIVLTLLLYAFTDGEKRRRNQRLKNDSATYSTGAEKL